MPALDVYSRQGCHLCEVLIEDLLQLVRSQAEIRIHDIDSRMDWRQAYDVRIPVVEADGQFLCERRLDRNAVLDKLAAWE